MEKRVTKILDRYRVTKGRGFRLKDYEPDDTAALEMEKTAAEALLQQGVVRLAEMQDKLYAQDRWSVLCIFQAMDAAGKDGAIRHVFSGVNPQGCQVHSFKAPGAIELDHDFLWRHSTALPERGRIGIHNRSWYEEALVLRVHPELLARQRLPPSLIGKKIWDERLEDIAAYERYLARQGTVVLKFFLNVSQDEQKKRFLSRIAEPEKNWKFSPNDVVERAHWDDYMKAYQAAISATAAPHAPWFVVPADSKWFTRLVVVAAIIEALEKLDLHYPAVTKEQRTALAVAKKSLG
ncbi:MAG: polyphosphate kinase 2 family protein [Roseomonas sp.]|nr:polyphosphate kinase 2 family protein [Roseomonas sp.]MCA3315262.1 polyphosphate kinase 2 family protein [Roseomonas sp.]MCA3316813.1 polyphosphate kinase 2 family protein [Roseomonas sp.]MCA3321390.1 polyphosphate kinase 2 family protein [Roseomonas sp.]MCA3344278.1 polyphosphate kinase 2 family protein [Roseomonas sp.]